MKRSSTAIASDRAEARADTALATPGLVVVTKLRSLVADEVLGCPTDGFDGGFEHREHLAGGRFLVPDGVADDPAGEVIHTARIDGFVDWQGNRYAVPYEHVTDILPIRVTQHELFVYGPELHCLARYELAPRGRHQQLDPYDDIVITGDSGTGKSHILEAIGLRACQQGLSFRYVRCVDLLQDLHAGLADDSYLRRLKGWVRPQLLVIDDVGLGHVRTRDDEPTCPDPPGRRPNHAHLTPRSSRRSQAPLITLVPPLFRASNAPNGCSHTNVATVAGAARPPAPRVSRQASTWNNFDSGGLGAPKKPP
ncbi:MAG: ATP-binding protein [Polyangiaceae bacterium]|nr:ATP-binding protein [Polyangiaceae bacterium]